MGKQINVRDVRLWAKKPESQEWENELMLGDVRL